MNYCKRKISEFETAHLSRYSQQIMYLLIHLLTIQFDTVILQCMNVYQLIFAKQTGISC